MNDTKDDRRRDDTQSQTGTMSLPSWQESMTNERAASLLRMALLQPVEPVSEALAMVPSVAHLLRCSSAGMLRTASKGEATAYLLCQTLLHQMPLMGQCDDDIVLGLCKLMQVAKASPEGRAMVRGLLLEKGGVEDV